MRELQFFQFGLMPFPFIPPAEEIESTWVTLPNSHYDPIRGHELYSNYLDQAVLAEKLGYDGTGVNEHHQNAYGTMPDPNLMAMNIAARTEHLKVAVVGNALPLHQNPIRVAESVAMLDVVSKGRIISGFVRGLGCEYHSQRFNPTFSRERFWEAHDLILKAWTEDGPFDWQSRHYDIPYVNPWPKPYQQPHPPIWLPGVGSPETIDEAAKRRYTFMMVFSPEWFLRASYDMYFRFAEEKYGYTPDPSQLAFTAPCYVAETDEIAHREAREHMEWLFHVGLKIPGYLMTPPGYSSGNSVRSMVTAMRKHGMKDFWELTYEELVDQRYILVGSPETVTETLAMYTDELKAGSFICLMQAGTMPNWQVVKNMTLFAEEVMPHFRPPGNQPTWARGVPAPGAASPNGEVAREPAAAGA